MKPRFALLAILLVVAVTADLAAFQQKNAPADRGKAGSSSPQTAPQAQVSQRLEGEQRFHTNCGRCHQPPHKFSPRMMATIIRHMRVRAMLTDEDMKLILQYMTQ